MIYFEYEKVCVNPFHTQFCVRTPEASRTGGD